MAEQPDHEVTLYLPSIILAWLIGPSSKSSNSGLSCRPEAARRYSLSLRRYRSFFISTPPFRTEISLVVRLSGSPSRLIGYKLNKVERTSLNKVQWRSAQVEVG